MTDSPGSSVAMLREIYGASLARCEPGAMLRDAVSKGRVSIPKGLSSIVAVGKCAAPLAGAAAGLTGIASVIVVHPEGYGEDVALPAGFERLTGSHPVPTAKSRHAARRAIAYVAGRREPVLFLVSGGASACMEDGLAPHVTLEELARVNELLLASGLAIDAINTVRRHLSAVKGGRVGMTNSSLSWRTRPATWPTVMGSGASSRIRCWHSPSWPSPAMLPAPPSCF